jgi:hypothetical protein
MVTIICIKAKIGSNGQSCLDNAKHPQAKTLKLQVIIYAPKPFHAVRPGWGCFRHYTTMNSTATMPAISQSPSSPTPALPCHVAKTFPCGR